MKNQTVTIKIEVSFLAAGQYEGHSEFNVNIPESALNFLDETKFNEALAEAISKARAEYNERNS